MLACWSRWQPLQQLQECVWKLPMPVLHGHSPPHPADSLSHCSQNFQGYFCLCTQDYFVGVFWNLCVLTRGLSSLVPLHKRFVKLDKNLTLNVTVSSVGV